MRLSKHCAAAVMLALVLGHSGFGETRTKSLTADEPDTDGVVASDYDATTADETLMEQDEISRAEPVSYQYYTEPTPYVPRMAYRQPVPSYGHLPAGAGGQYPGTYQNQFASASAKQFANGGGDAGGCGCEGGCDAGGCDRGVGCSNTGEG